MWQSMLMATPIVGSARTIGIEGFSHSNSGFPQFHSKVRNLQTLASYRLPEKFKSIALYPKSTAIRVSDSSTTDSVTGNLNENGSREDIRSVVNLLSRSDLPSLSKLDDMKLNLDEELVTRVLSQCQYSRLPGNKVIDFVKWAAGRDNRIVNEKILDELIRAVSWEEKTDPVYNLWCFLEEAVYKYDVSTTTNMLNEVISMFSFWDEGMAAYFVFNSFENLQCERDADSYYLTIQALIFGEQKLYDVAGLLCEKMITEDMLPEGEKVGEIIEFLCLGGRMKDAISVYKSATEKKIDIPRESLRCLVNSLCTRKNEDDDYVNFAVQMLH